MLNHKKFLTLSFQRHARVYAPPLLSVHWSGCRRLRRLGYPAAAWAAMAVLGSATVGASLFAGLLGPVAIAVYAVVLSLPVWLVCRLVDRRR